MRLAERRRRFDRTLDYFALADQACSGKCGINPAGVQETTAGFEEWGVCVCARVRICPEFV